jgi:hypothetical protein
MKAVSWPKEGGTTVLVPYIRSLTDRHIRMPGDNEFGPGSPPEDFMRCTLKAVCPAMGGGRTKSLGIILADFIGAMTRAEKRWARVGNDGWVCRARGRTGSTGPVREVFYGFEEMGPTSFVLMSHIVHNGKHMTAQDAIFFGFLVSVTTYTQKDEAAGRGSVCEDEVATVPRDMPRMKTMESYWSNYWYWIDQRKKMRPKPKRFWSRIAASVGLFP